jgi:hypothetical protein
MSAEERAWCKASSTDVSSFLWSLRLGDLKVLGTEILKVPGFSEVRSRTAAVETLYQFIMSNGVLDAESDGDYDPSAGPSTGGQIPAPPGTAEVFRGTP